MMPGLPPGLPLPDVLCHMQPPPGWDPADACPMCAHSWLSHAAAASCLTCVQFAVAVALVNAGQQIAAILGEATGSADPLTQPTLGEEHIAAHRAREAGQGWPPGPG
jgi:hypothetical protein